MTLGGLGTYSVVDVDRVSRSANGDSPVHRCGARPNLLGYDCSPNLDADLTVPLAGRGRAGEAFGAALRRAREERRMSQKVLAASIGVAAAQISQWESGRHIPQAPTIDKLGGALDALDALREAAALGGPRGNIGPSDNVGRDGGTRLPSDSLTLLKVHRDLGEVMLEHLVFHPDGRPHGWRRDFIETKPPSAFTTASAARTVLMLHDPPYVDRHALGESLLGFHVDELGWQTRAVGLRPEATAVVLDALDRLGAAFDVDGSLVELGNLLDAQNRSHTYVLAEGLSISARLRPRSSLAEGLARDLLEAQQPSGAWGEKNRPTIPGVVLAPSTAHTARALTVLVHALARGLRDGDGRLHAATVNAQSWLEQNAELAPTQENVSTEDSPDMEIRHFTSALVAHALASVAEPDRGLLERAVDWTWRAYNPVIRRWQWPNGDVPVWLQLDALRAVTVAQSRLTQVKTT